jgi:hypothetical protein
MRPWSRPCRRSPLSAIVSTSGIRFTRKRERRNAAARIAGNPLARSRTMKERKRPDAAAIKIARWLALRSARQAMIGETGMRTKSGVAMMIAISVSVRPRPASTTGKNGR